jgi:uncharacterized membrane protein
MRAASTRPIAAANSEKKRTCVGAGIASPHKGTAGYGADQMRVLLSFAPLILFPFVAGFYSVAAGLWVAAMAAFLAVAGDRLISHRAVKLLDAGQLCLFGALAIYATALRVSPDVEWVRLVINAGLLAIVLGSVAVGRPFTLQYAREQTPEELWRSARFIATNYRISSVWAAAFGVSVAADLARLGAPGVSHGLESVASIGALVLAGIFTGWYPKHVRASARSESD